MKLIKISLWILMVLVVLVVGSVLVITNLVDPNDYKPRIAEMVRDQTGRELDLSGNLELTFYPWLGIETGAMTLSNAPGFGGQPMLELANVRASVKLVPLLSKQVEISTIVLDTPRLHLATLADGRSNWDDLVVSLAGETASNASPSAQGAGAITSLAVQGVSVVNGQVALDDGVAGKQARLDNFNLSTGSLVPGEPLDISLATDASGSMLPVAASISLKTTLTLSKNMASIGLGKTGLSVQGENRTASLDIDKVFYAIESGLAAVNGLTIDIEHEGEKINAIIPSVNLDQSAQTMEMPELTVIHGENRIKASISASDIFDAPAANGDFAIQSPDILPLLAILEIENPVPGIAISDLDTGGRYLFENNVVSLEGFSLTAGINQHRTSLELETMRFDISSDSLLLDAFQISQDDFSASGRLSGTGVTAPEGPSALSASVQLSMGALDSLLSRNGVDIELPDIPISTISLNTNIELTGNDLFIRDLQARLDDTGIKGNVDLVGLDAPAYRFDLDIDSLDLDRLASEPSAAAEGAEADTVDQLLMPIAPFQGLVADGEVRIARLVTTGLVLADVHITVQSDGNALRVNPVTASVAGGSITVNLVYDVSGNIPSISFANTTDNVDVGELLAVLDITSKVEGKGALSANLNGSGADLDQVIASLDGDMGFRLFDGALKGFDLQAALLKVQTGLANYKGQEVSASQQPEAQTRFTELTGTFNVVDGVFDNRDLAMKAPAFRVGGAGRIDLPGSWIDYNLDVNIVSSVEGQGGQSLDELKGASIPLKIAGPLESPGFKLDIARLLQDEAKKAATELIKKELGLDSSTEDELQSQDAEPAEPAKSTTEELKDQLKKDLTKELFKSLGLD